MKNFEIYNQNDAYKLDRDQRWPVVYILKDNKNIYIGETTNIHNRMYNHNKDSKKMELNEKYIIKHNMANKSSMFLLESDLINRAFADKTYTLINSKMQSNEVLSGHDFYQKKEFKKELEIIWNELKDMGIFSRNYDEIENEELFKYSPWKEFDEYQLKSIRGVKDAIINNENAFVQGAAGTGKTLVIIRTAMEYVLDNSDKIIGIFSAKTGNYKTFRRVLNNLESFYKKRIKVLDKIRDDDLKKIDYILVDEAQRMRKWFRGQGSPEYFKNNEKNEVIDEIHQLKNNKLNYALYYDCTQSFHKYDLDLEKYIDNSKEYNLISQYRMKSGEEWIKFIKDLLQIKETSKIKNNDFDLTGYDVKVFDSQNELYYKVLEMNKSIDGFDNKSRMLASLSVSKWETKQLFNNLEKAKIKNYTNINAEFKFDDYLAVWNKDAHYSDWLEKSDVSEIGCVHTAQGRDFKYVGVLFGNDISIDNGKIIATDEVKNSYYILLTRGIFGTGLYTNDPKLKAYFKKKIKTN